MELHGRRGREGKAGLRSRVSDGELPPAFAWAGVAEALVLADHIGSTAALLKFSITSDAQQFIVATESGIIHQMQKACPDKSFIPAPPNDSTCACNDCEYMKLNTIEKLYNCLKYEWPAIEVSEDIRKEAVKPINRMLEISEKYGL